MVTDPEVAWSASRIEPLTASMTTITVPVSAQFNLDPNDTSVVEAHSNPKEPPRRSDASSSQLLFVAKPNWARHSRVITESSSYEKRRRLILSSPVELYSEADRERTAEELGSIHYGHKCGVCLTCTTIERDGDSSDPTMRCMTVLSGHLDHHVPYEISSKTNFARDLCYSHSHNDNYSGYRSGCHWLGPRAHQWCSSFRKNPKDTKDTGPYIIALQELKSAPLLVVDLSKLVILDTGEQRLWPHDRLKAGDIVMCPLQYHRLALEAPEMDEEDGRISWTNQSNYDSIYATGSKSPFCTSSMIWKSDIFLIDGKRSDEHYTNIYETIHVATASIDLFSHYMNLAAGPFAKVLISVVGKRLKVTNAKGSQPLLTLILEYIGTGLTLHDNGIDQRAPLLFYDPALII